MEQSTEEITTQTEIHEDTVNNSDKEEDPDVLATFAYEPELPPEVTFSRLRQLYMFDLTGTGYDKQPWILENAPRLEHLSWRGGYNFEFPAASITTALESGSLSRLECLELRGSHLSDQEIAQILSRMNRLVKLVAPRTELGPAAMKQLFQHFETVRELDISGCENVRSWMIQMFLCKFISLEVFVADMLSLQDITTDPWVCSRLRKLSLDFELGYIDKEEEGVQDTIEDEEDSDDEEEEGEEYGADADADAIEEEGHKAAADGQAETGQNELSSAQGETEAIVVGDKEGESAAKKSEIDVVVAVAEVDVEQAVVETVIAGGEEIQGHEPVAIVSIASETVVDSAAAVFEQSGDTNEAGSVEEGEGGEGDEATPEFTPEEMAAAIAAAQWDLQQMEADAAEAEAEENLEDLWKNLVPYVHSDARQRIIFERLGQLKYLEELNIKQQTERPYSAAEQLRAGVVQKVLDLSLDNGMDLLSGLTRLREFYFPGPQEMEEREVRWIIEHWGERLTHMTGELNRRRKVNHKLLKLLSEHKIDAAMCMF
ncbi:MAG: hypothetical protein J3R72DRAFT_454203 [Linnemannia gamsii]|nr:MAG: hypothetical protein J3R72DRAFT_454203 [Linnemannia gamsii]